MATPIPDNAAPFELTELVEVTSGQLLQGGPARIAGVSTDTRARLEGKAFVALRGEHFDAHELLPQAVESGARCLLVERDTQLRPEGVAVVRVASTRGALGQLARHHRRRWGGRVIAVAGSAGKTTTRSAIEAVLRALRPGKVHATRGNLNNLVGLPLTLLAALPEHELCVLEVGTNRTGEVPALARVCEPDVGLLTLIDLEHSEGLGDLDGIEREEGALLALLGARGLALGNGDDERVRRQVEQSPAAQKVLYGASPRADYRIVERRPHHDRDAEIAVTRPAGGAPAVFQCPLLGEPGALAATAAFAVAELVCGGPIEGALLSRALRHVGEDGRLARVQLADGCLVLDDSYNANPASVQKSIETAQELAELRGGRLWLVLGEMRELGRESAAEHRRMGEFAARSSASGLFVIGVLAEAAAAAASGGGLSTTFVEEPEQVVSPLLEKLESKDVVLVKASRGVRAERVVAGLTSARGKSQ